MLAGVGEDVGNDSPGQRTGRPMATIRVDRVRWRISSIDCWGDGSVEKEGLSDAVEDKFDRMIGR